MVCIGGAPRKLCLSAMPCVKRHVPKTKVPPCLCRDLLPAPWRAPPGSVHSCHAVQDQACKRAAATLISTGLHHASGHDCRIVSYSLQAEQLACTPDCLMLPANSRLSSGSRAGNLTGTCICRQNWGAPSGHPQQSDALHPAGGPGAAPRAQRIRLRLPHP